MKNNKYIQIIFLILLALACQNCAESQKDKKLQENETTLIPVVNDSRSDLILSWLEDGKTKISSKVEDIPGEFRSSVRVQDPSIPPEKKNLDEVFVTELKTKDKNGNYTVKVLTRNDFENLRNKQRPKLDTTNPIAGLDLTKQAPNGGQTIIMYATNHCPICHKARRWLLERKIPYREINLEKDQAAAQSLAKKGQQQGVRTTGVPIFEINGILVPGFDPEAIIQTLQRSQKPSSSLPNSQTI